MTVVETPGGARATVWGNQRRRLLASTADRLGSEREAQWIVEHVEHIEHVEAEDAAPMTPDERTRQVEGLVTRRASGEPLQYVLGSWPFRSLELRVDPRVLIPRPETEQVVGVALAELHRMHGGAMSDGAQRGGNEPSVVSPVCVDLGTGSGAIALAMATEACLRFPKIEVWATDVSDEALEVARLNLASISKGGEDGGIRVRFGQGSWFDALPPELRGRVDLIVSNPPYVSESEYAELEPGVRDWEPRGALVAPFGAGGVGGMADIETIVANAPGWLHSRGVLVVEIAPRQAYAAIDAARRGGFAQVTTERDLAGRLRMLVARR